MNLWPERDVFRASLRAWAIRGVFCALPSFVLAVMVTSRRPLEIAEMVAGVATYVLGFAWITVLPEFRQHMHGSDLGWALRVAANTRAALVS